MYLIACSGLQNYICGQKEWVGSDGGGGSEGGDSDLQRVRVGKSALSVAVVFVPMCALSDQISKYYCTV